MLLDRSVRTLMFSCRKFTRQRQLELTQLMLFNRFYRLMDKQRELLSKSSNRSQSHQRKRRKKKSQRKMTKLLQLQLKRKEESEKERRQKRELHKRLRRKKKNSEEELRKKVSEERKKQKKNLQRLNHLNLIKKLWSEVLDLRKSQRRRMSQNLLLKEKHKS